VPIIRRVPRQGFDAVEPVVDKILAMKIRAQMSIAVFLLFAASAAQRAGAQDADKTKGSVERGKYLVEGVAMCTRCHTPGNQNGEGERRNWLAGGPLQIQPTYSVADWALVTPRLAGGPPGTDADFIRLLTTGISRTGAPPRPPMPPFRMTREDAASVLAYLKSLKL
jgi:mono/diheme cytochrome c family protein